MVKYTPAMEAALTQMPLSNEIQGPPATLHAMSRRGLCFGVACLSDGNYRATLSYQGHQARLEIAQAGGFDLISTLREARTGRLASNAVTRISRARESAMLVAVNAKGGSLTPEEKRMIAEVIERVIDVFEEGASRLLLCPHCDHVLGGDHTDDKIKPCPEHGYQTSFPGGFGICDLAVRYHTMSHPSPG